MKGYFDMRSRIMNAPEEKILIYGFDAAEEERFRRTSDKLKIGLKVLPRESASEQVGYLAGFAGFSSCGEKSERDERCVIFSCIDGKRLNKVLDAMRENGLGGIPLKAAVTAYNQKMTLSELMDELAKEHEKMHSK